LKKAGASSFYTMALDAENDKLGMLCTQDQLL